MLAPDHVREVSSDEGSEAGRGTEKGKHGLGSSFDPTHMESLQHPAPATPIFLCGLQPLLAGSGWATGKHENQAMVIPLPNAMLGDDLGQKPQKSNGEIVENKRSSPAMTSRRPCYSCVLVWLCRVAGAGRMENGKPKETEPVSA